MNRIYVCPLSDLEATLATSGARRMISLMGPGKATARPEQVDNGFLAMEFHDIGEPRDGLSPPRANIWSSCLVFWPTGISARTC